MINSSPAAERLFGLDAARGLASLVVVLQHWPQHFWLVPGFTLTTTSLPLFTCFKPFYLEGARAVSFFFVLSGFIFYWLYAAKVHERKVSLLKFAVFRLARLYPLHLLTLLLVVLGQWKMRELLGHDFVYQWNDLKHLLLNLALIQNWGLQDGYSWNSPSWSISVEVGLYLVFFLCCRLLTPKFWQALLFLVVMWLLAPVGQIFSSAVPFFVGGLCFLIWRTVRPTWTWPRHALLFAVTAAVWWMVPTTSDTAFILATAQSIANIAGGSTLSSAAAFIVQKILQRQYDVIIFPLTVLLIALSEHMFSSFPWRRLHEFGNLSFGIYLLHFPLQIVFVWWALSNKVDADFFKAPSTMSVFFALLIFLSVLSYRYFERPTMDWVRDRWLKWAQH